MSDTKPDWRRLMRGILSKLRRLKPYVYFKEPVDSVELNIPNYPFLIKKPMDLGTVEIKFSDGVYSSAEEMAADIVLTFENALLFNGPPSYDKGGIYADSKNIFNSFQKAYQAKFGCQVPSIACTLVCENPEIRPPDLPTILVTPSNRIVLLDLLKKMSEKYQPHIQPFLFPVDAAHFPDYYTTIKFPMALHIIETKLHLNKYETAEHFARDVRQVWLNSQAYNTNGDTKLARTAKKLGEKFEKYFALHRDIMMKGDVCTKKTKKRKRKNDGNIDVSKQHAIAVATSTPISNDSSSKMNVKTSMMMMKMKPDDRPTLSSSSPSSTVKAVEDKVNDETLLTEVDSTSMTRSIKRCMNLDAFQTLRAASAIHATAADIVRGMDSLRSRVKREPSISRSECARYFVASLTSSEALRSNASLYTAAKRLRERGLAILQAPIGLPLKPPTPTRAACAEIKRVATECVMVSAGDDDDGDGGEPKFSKNGCLHIVNTLLEDPRSAPFQKPVDRALTNYYIIIKRPMDLGTLKKRLVNDSYATNAAFCDDMCLIWSNCRTFNVVSLITQMADQLEAKFKQMFVNLDKTAIKRTRKVKASLETKKVVIESATVATNDASYFSLTDSMTEEVRAICSSSLQRLLQLEGANDFATAFDPVQLGYVCYDEVIKRRMDLHTAMENLHSNQYASPQAFFDDVLLCFTNALLYKSTPLLLRISAQFMLNQARLEMMVSFPGKESCHCQWYSRASQTLLRITEYDQGNLFSAPVNPALFNLVTYFDKIKEPRDLATIKRKLDAGLYLNEDSFLADVELMWQNCIEYHGDANHLLTSAARDCRDVFTTQWAKHASPVTIKPIKNDNQLRESKVPKKHVTAGCSQIIRKLKKMDTMKAFSAPVDLEMNPTYRDFVEELADLGTFESNLNAGRILTVNEYCRQIRLIFANCRQYNVENSPVRILGDQMSVALEKMLQVALKNGKLETSLKEMNDKAIKRLAERAAKDEERVAKKLVKDAEKAEKLKEKEQQREIRQSNTVTRPSKRARVSDAPLNLPAEKVQRVNHSAVKPNRVTTPMFVSVDDSTLVKCHPPRAPLLYLQRNLLMAFARRRISELGFARVTKNDINSSVSMEPRGAVRSKDTVTLPIAPTPTKVGDNAKLCLHWKARKGRKRCPTRTVLSTLQIILQKSNTYNNKALNQWSTKLQTWMMAYNQIFDKNYQQIPARKSYVHGNAIIFFSVMLPASRIIDASKKLGFVSHSTLPALQVRALHATITVDAINDINKMRVDNVADNVGIIELDVVHIIIFAEQKLDVDIEIRVSPLSGKQWQQLLSIKNTIARTRHRVAMHDDFSVLCEPDVEVVSRLYSSACHVGLPSNLDVQWCREGCYVAQKQFGKQHPVVSMHAIGLRGTINIFINGVHSRTFIRSAE